MVTRKQIANYGIIGLVGLEVVMGTASMTPDVPAAAVTILMVSVLLIGSILQATLMSRSLYHRRHGNWRQWPSFAIQGALFLMIAWWAHDGLGNTIFQGVNEILLYLAGCGLGLLTMFGPEVVNHDYDEEPKAADGGTIVSSKPVTAFQGLSYTSRIEPPRVVSEAHNIALERAAEIAA